MGAIASIAGAALGFAGSNKASKSANSAANASAEAQKYATDQTIALQREQDAKFESRMAPYANVGNAAMPYLMQQSLGGDIGYWQNALTSQASSLPNANSTTTNQTPALTTSQAPMTYTDYVAKNYPTEQPTIIDGIFNKPLSDGGDRPFSGTPEADQRAAYDSYVAGLQQPTTNTTSTTPYDPTNGGQFAGPTGRSADIDRSQALVDQLGGMNSQFNIADYGTGQYQLATPPNAQIGNAFTANTVNQDYTTGQVANPGFTTGYVAGDFTSGNVQNRYGQNPSFDVNQQFTEGYVNPNIAIDYNAIRNDPMYQFAQQEAAKSANRNLASQGLTESRYGADVLSDAAMRTALAARDRVYGQGLDLYNMEAGNEGRLFGSQQATAGLGLSNVANRMTGYDQAYAQDAGNAARLLQSQGMQYDAGAGNAARLLDSQRLGYGVSADNAARLLQSQGLAGQQGQFNATQGWNTQLANYGRDTDTYNNQMAQDMNQYNVDVANYGRAGDLALQGYGNEVDNYSRGYDQLNNQMLSGNQLDTQQYNMINNLTNMGQQASAGLGSAGQNSVNALTNAYQNNASALGNIYAGNARAQAAYNPLQGALAGAGAGASIWNSFQQPQQFDYAKFNTQNFGSSNPSYWDYTP